MSDISSSTSVARAPRSWVPCTVLPFVRVDAVRLTQALTEKLDVVVIGAKTSVAANPVRPSKVTAAPPRSWPPKRVSSTSPAAGTTLSAKVQAKTGGTMPFGPGGADATSAAEGVIGERSVSDTTGSPAVPPHAEIAVAMPSDATTCEGRRIACLQCM